MFGDKSLEARRGHQPRFAREAKQVTGESTFAVKRAKAYLQDLSRVAIRGEELRDILDGVR